MTDVKRRLFEAEKLGIFIDDIGHRKIKTKDGEVRMLDLQFRVEPLTPELAGEIDPLIRRTIYEMTSGEPKRSIQAIGFKFKVPQQNLSIFTTPDTAKPRIMFDRCDISNIIIRSVKQYDGFGLRFRASFGNPTREQLEYVDANLYSQVFVTAEQTDPDLFADYGAPPKLRKKEHQPDLQEDPDNELDNAVDQAAEEASSATPPAPRLPARRQKEPRASKPAGKRTPAKGAKRSHHKKR